jgi:hypothetical protein
MLAGDFLVALKVLNPKLRVYSLGDNGKLAGIYYLDHEGHYQDVCSIDKNEIPEFPIHDDDGHLVKAGWRRAVFILLQHRLTTSRRVRRLWPGFFMRREPAAYVPKGDPIERRLNTLDPDQSTLSPEELLSLAETIRKKDSAQRQEEREHDKWFLKKWKSNGGAASDRPAY